MEEKDILVHETEISVTSIPAQERKEEAISISRKHKQKLGNIQAGVKYNKIYHTKKMRTENDRETMHHRKELERKKKKRKISKLIPYLLSCPKHACGI